MRVFMYSAITYPSRSPRRLCGMHQTCAMVTGLLVLEDAEPRNLLQILAQMGMQKTLGPLA